MNQFIKCIVLFVIISNLSFLVCNGQSAYNDAITIKNNLESNFLPSDTNKLKSVYSILKGYTKDTIKNSPTTIISSVNSEFVNNPFLNAFGIGAVGFGASPPTISSLISSFGNLNVTPFADGLAKFLIKRSKEELYISFFSKLQDTAKFPEFKILFPHTKTVVDNFKSWEYANVINTFREAFDKDFKSLLANIPKLKTLTESNCGCTDYKNVKDRVNKLSAFLNRDEGRILLSAFIIGNGFTSQEKIPDIIHDVADTSYLGGLPIADKNIRNSIKLLDILSCSVRSNEYGKNYINKDTFLLRMTDSVTRNIYLGLLYQQFQNDSLIIGNDTLTNILTPQTYTGVRNFIENLLSSYKDIDTAYNNLSAAKKKGETDLNNYWGALFTSANEFLQKSTNIQIIAPTLKFPDKLQNVFNLSQQTLQISHDIAVRNYSAVVVGTINFISRNINSKQNPKIDSLSGFKEFFVKYGSFAANVVEAKNSDDVEKAIESVALPVGSALIKKKTAFNIALNGYLGGFYGNEYLKATTGQKWAPITGVYAPVGITISKGLDKAGAISVFGSIIDIGAFASYRLQDDTTKTLPEVSLKNILAPGGGIIYGLPGLPLSVGYTYQFGPMLREIKSSGINASDHLNHRWQFFLAVDIPIVNFFTKSRE